VDDPANISLPTLGEPALGEQEVLTKFLVENSNDDEMLINNSSDLTNITYIIQKSNKEVTHDLMMVDQ
jgi:hypothetical protein